MKTIINAFILVLCFLCISCSCIYAQITQWPVEVKGSRNGAGTPKQLTYGYNPEAITSFKENKIGKKPKKNAKPAKIHFKYKAFDASQIVVSETFNPGAISKIVIRFKPHGSRRRLKKTVWKGKPTPTPHKYTVKNFHFDLTQNITDVWLTIDYAKVEEVNQYGGVCLVNSTVNYTPKINLPKKEIFTKNIKRLNDDINGIKNPKGLILSADGHHLYFSHEENRTEKIYKAKLDSAKNIIKVELSDFNLPGRISKTCGLIGVNQDNNVAYVSNMLLNKFQFYETYLGTSFLGKPKWKYEKNQIMNYKNGGIYIDYTMSYDGNILILGYKENGKHGDLYNEDLFISFKDSNDNWSKFKHMEYDINSIGYEAPCFLASDNKTLYFISDGRIGYGEGDIYVSKRLDETWTSWSKPVNLGPNINTEEHENSFIIDPVSKKVFFIRWDDENSSNIYTLDISTHVPENKAPEPARLIANNIDSSYNEPNNKIKEIETSEEKDNDELLPSPVIIVSGKTLNKNTGEPIQAEIYYSEIFTGKNIGKAISNAKNGEYTIILRKGIFFSIEARAEGYISENLNVNTTEISKHENIICNLKLNPIKKNQVIRLNNIFFNTDESVLLDESFLELKKLIELMNNKPKMKIEIGGHTDDIGPDSYNLTLSEQRAESVCKHLIDKGIKPKRITPIGYGENKPSVPNINEENRAINRRVEFTILEID